MKRPFIYKPNTSVEKVKGLIIALSGLQLTRKAQASIVAQKRGYYVISTGDFIREKCIEQGLDLTSFNISNVADNIIKNNEINLIKKIRPIIISNITQYKGVVIDSIKSKAGIQYLIDNFTDVFVVGFLASFKFRYEHSVLRSRFDDANSIQEFHIRDKREIQMGIAQVIVFADYFLIAEDIKQSRKQFSIILNDIERDINENRI